MVHQFLCLLHHPLRQRGGAVPGPGGAVAQAKTLEAAGYQEIVVTGIELSGYGRDLPGRPGLADLVEAVCRAVPGRGCGWVPGTQNGDRGLCRRLAALPNLCPPLPPLPPERV